MPLAEDQEMVEAVFADGAPNRSEIAFALGARTGVLITRIPSERTISSKEPAAVVTRAGGECRCPPHSLGLKTVAGALRPNSADQSTQTLERPLRPRAPTAQTPPRVGSRAVASCGNWLARPEGDAVSG